VSRADAVASTRAPRQRASCTAKVPTPPAPPAADKEAPLPADAHVAQSIQLDGKPLHYTVTVGTLPVNDNGKKIGEVVFTAYTWRARTGRSPSR
jgi:carboxypeptidase C (cathepsin A)